MKKYIIIIMLIFIAAGCEKGGGVMEKKVADTDVKNKGTFAKPNNASSSKTLTPLQYNRGLVWNGY